MSRREPSRLDQIDAVWALLARVLAFFGGAVLAAYEAKAMTDDTWLRIVFGLGGFAMMGPVIATSIASMLTALRGSGK